MQWLIFVIISVLSDSSRIYSDNYISDEYFKGRHAVAQKLFFAYAFTILAFILLLITGFNFSSAPVLTFLLIFLSGFLDSFSGIPYYKALEIDNSTNLGIFVQLAPILYLILGWLFLGDTISPTQLVAFVIILIAPLLIFFTTAKRSRRTKLRAIAYASLYVLITVISNLIFVKENTYGANFITEMALVFLGKGAGNFFIMLVRPTWRRRFYAVVKSSKKKVFRPLTLSLSLSFIKDFTYRAAFTLAPTMAIASVVSDAAEPIIIFFMGIILTLIWPKFGREKLNRKSIIAHLIATILVVIGIILIQL